MVFTSSDSLKDARLVAPRLTTEWQLQEKSKRPIVQRLQQLSAESKATTPEQRKSAAFQQAKAQQQAAITRDRNSLDSAFIMAHPTSLVSLNQLDLLSNSKADKKLAKVLFAVLSPPLRECARPENRGKTAGARCAHHWYACTRLYLGNARRQVRNPA